MRTTLRDGLAQLGDLSSLFPGPQPGVSKKGDLGENYKNCMAED